MGDLLLSGWRISEDFRPARRLRGGFEAMVGGEIARAEAFLRALEAPYFVDVGTRSLGSFLRVQGFSLCRADATRLTFRRGRCLLQFSYEPEASPRYTLSIEIGLKRRWLSTRLLETTGLWRAPNANDDPSQWLLDFRSPDQLESVANRACRLLELYARPLWEDEKRLRRLLLEAWKSMQREHENPNSGSGGFLEWSQRIGGPPSNRD